MKNRVWSITILVFVISSFLILPAYSQEQKQFQVNTKMEFPESLPLGETADFKIHVTYKGPFSWVKNMEPRFEIVPTRAQSYAEIKTDESFSQYTVWKGHINTLHGTIHVSEDSPFDAIFLSVSFDGDIRFDEQATSVDPDSTVSLRIGELQQDITDEPTFHEGHVEWMSRCYMIGSDITVRVIDPDMNNDPQRIEEVNITVWSDNDDREVTYVATETDNDTGVFDSKIFFTTTDSSPGKRIRAIDGSIIHAKYVDYTFSDSYKAIDMIDTFVMSGLDILEKDSRGIPSKITYDSCALVLLEKNQEKFNELDVFYPAPLKQLKVGLLHGEIRCKDSLVPINDSHGLPACVKPESVQELHERGWASDVNFDERLAREKGYLVTYMVFRLAGPDHIIAIDLEGPHKQVEQILKDYEVSVMSNKTSDDGLFSSTFGNMTHANMQRFFEENPMNHFVKRGLMMYPLGGYTDNTGTYDPYNQFVTEVQGYEIGQIIQEYENRHNNAEKIGEVRIMQLIESLTGD